MISVLQQNPWLFYTAAGIAGLLAGSFLNVVIHRLPKMMEREWRAECSRLMGTGGEDLPRETFNLVLPGSACPNCRHRIGPLENIPVLSYLFLKGRCRSCRARISWRYPLIEALGGALALVVAVHFGVTPQAVFAILLTWALIALTAIDYEHQLLPDDITLPFLWLGILCNMFGLYTDVYSSLLGAMGGYLVLWAVYIAFKLATGKEGMGYGDFKLLAMLGAWLGWQMLPLVIILSSLLGAVVGICLIVFRSHEKSRPIPFGPYLALAGWVALIYGRDLTGLYLDWIMG